MTKDPITQDPWTALSRAVSDLLARFPFYGHVLGMLARKMDPDLPCAAAIGIGTKSMLFINPDFFFRENPKKQMGILVHEIEHVIRLHIPRFEGLIHGNPFLKKKANIAMDLAVNSTLHPEILPDWVLFPRQFHLPDGQSAEWYFSHLPQPEVPPVKYRIYTSDTENHSRNASPGELVRDDFDTESVDNACGGHIPMELTKTIIRDLVRNSSDKTTRSRGLGLRLGEILSLKWDQVHIDTVIDPHIEVIHTKNNKKRFVPLNDDMVNLLKSLNKNSSDYVFLGSREKPLKSVRKPFEKALRKAGISSFRFHDLRHTFASHFVMNGGDVLSLKEILGHSSMKMVERYAHLASAHKLRQINNLNGKFSVATYLPPDKTTEEFLTKKKPHN